MNEEYKDWDAIKFFASERGINPEPIIEEARAVQPKDRLKVQGNHYQERIYALVRIFKPMKMVETGVRTGVSTKYILEALEKNNKGHLVSCDPCYSGQKSAEQWLWRHLDLESHCRWVFHGKTSKCLLEDKGPWDFFLHDSDHMEENYKFELEMAWERLSPGGILAVDDYRVYPVEDLSRNHCAFEKFCKAKNLEWFTFGDLWSGLCFKP